MTTPNSPRSDQEGLWQSIIKGAEGLPPPLRFVVVFGVLLAVLFIAGPAIPDNLAPLLYILLIGGMLLYAWWEYQQTQWEKDRRRHELEREREAPAAAALIEPDPPDPAGGPENPRRRYLLDLVDRCGSLSMSAIDPRAQHSRAARISLQSVFTTLDVAPTARPEEMGAAAEGRQKEREEREPVLAAISRRRLVLLGQPGSGKTTLVNFITYCLAGEKLGDESVNLARLAEMGWQLPGLLPLRVVLRDYAARGLPAGQGIWAFVAAELAERELGGWVDELRNHLKERGGILLLDGLDEVPQAQQRREQLRRAVLDFVGDFDRVRVVVTSRPYAYDADWQLPRFGRADLLDFSEEQIDNYVDSWYAVTGKLDPDLEPAVADRYAERLKREVRDNPNLADLAPRPLSLAL